MFDKHCLLILHRKQIGMGITERKEREKQGMRELILKEATQMFIEDGYDKTSIRNLAERIEYSPATIYLYYKDKDEIFYAIHEQGFEMLLTRMQEAEGVLNPYEKLFKLGYIYLKFAFDNPEYYDLMFIMRSPMKSLKPEEDWNCGFKSYNSLKDTVRACVEQGYIKPLDVEQLSFSILSYMHGMTSLAIRDRFKMYTPEQVQQLMQGAITMLMEMLKNEPDGK